MIPNVSPKFPDELLYSWVCRLAEGNALSLPVFTEAHLGKLRAKTDSLPSDIRKGFTMFYKGLWSGDDMGEMYLALTTFGFESIFMTRGLQSRHLANVFQPSDGLNPPVYAMFKTMKVCPDCVREDTEAFGRPYLHRSHQLSGVCTCHIHGTRLQVYSGPRGHACEYDPKAYLEPEQTLSDADERAYTDYAQALFTSGISSDSRCVKRAVFKRMAQLGYGAADDYESLLDDFEGWEHSGLWCGGDMVRFLKVKMIQAQYLNAPETLPLLMFLYPDPEDLVNVLESREPLVTRHVCPVCGTAYCEPAGPPWGCPECNSGLSEDERFRRMARNISDGEYEPLEPFVSLDKKLRFRHAACGEEVSIKPRGFIFEDVRCMCEYTVSEEEARQAVEANEGFKLIEYTRTEGPVTVYHEACGREFSCRYRKFIQFPGCRACNPPDMTAELFSERVRDLTDGEYEAVSDFVDQQTPVEILHTVCGKTQMYLPRHFISDQQRCHACGKMPAWEESFHILEQYKAEHGSVNVPKRASYKGYSLGRWCQGQRDNYKKGALTAEQIRRLEEIGFAWDPLEAEWQDNLARYGRYAAKKGRYIPRRADFENVHLGAWVDTQKKRYREGKLSKQRADLLLQVNPDLFNERS